jgi:holliday junction DNA helicase RuvA
MIGRLAGTYLGTTPDGSALIDVRGVGYAVRTTANGFVELTQNPSSAVLLIHTAVKDDAIDLYGFPNNDELAFFRLLLEVSGVGPKTALGILNLAGVETLRSAIAAGDASYLTRVSGVGKKSAERIVVELKDKLAKLGYGEGHEGRREDADVLDALTNLGYSLDEARTALKQVSSEASDIQTRMKEALKVLSGEKH